MLFEMECLANRAKVPKNGEKALNLIRLKRFVPSMVNLLSGVMEWIMYLLPAK